MSIIGSNILAGASGQGGGYTIDESLRFNASQSSYLSRTPSAGNRKTWTFSFWLKRGSLGGTQLAGINSGDSWMIRFNTADKFACNFAKDTVTNYFLDTTRVFRDTSAWYHIVISCDTTQAVASNRIKAYINGELETITGGATSIPLNYDTDINVVAQHRIGAEIGNRYYFDGYLTEINFIDGQALDPSSFGEFDIDTGVWKPKKYTGTYGTNGFYLNFSDASTTTTLGYDYSGQSNNWLLNNFSLTGTAYCSMTDTPTLYAGGGNYATLNPIWGNSNPPAFSNANLVASPSGSGYNNAISTIAVPASDYWYAEFTATANVPYGGGNNNSIGVVATTRGTLSGSNYIGQSSDTYGYFDGGGLYNNGSISQTVASYVTGDVIMVALGNGKLWWGKNGTWLGTGSPNPATATSPAFSGLSGDYFFGAMTYNSPYGGTWATNFGQRPFAYTPPTGFKALHTGNLPDSNIVDGSKYFDVLTYTGTSTTQSITGLEFQPDFTWFKSRSNADPHVVYDAVRGGVRQLYPNLTDAEYNVADGFNAFTSDGFTLDNTSGGGNVNINTRTYVAWNWKANGTGVSNGAGSIESTVSANPTAGFSVVSFVNASSTNQETVGHGLGVAPKLIISKNRDTSANNWAVFHSAVCDTTSKFLKLNTTDAVATFSTVWGAALPTSSVFGVTGGGIAAASANVIAYCFADVEGYSKFGSYLGNNSSDGVFVYLGFRPRFLMIKSTSAGTEWVMIDTERSSYNLSDTSLYANRNYSEATITAVNDVDILSNGFKLRNNTGYVNASQTYIYAAFAENPFKNSLAR